MATCEMHFIASLSCQAGSPACSVILIPIACLSGKRLFLISGWFTCLAASRGEQGRAGLRVTGWAMVLERVSFIAAWGFEPILLCF